MGICPLWRRDVTFPRNIELAEITCPNNDFSSIYTILQALDNLNNFKNVIFNNKKQSQIKIGKTLKKILSSNFNNNLNKYAKIIYYRIHKNNKNIVELHPGKILIKLLELLNNEQKSIINDKDQKEKKNMINNFQALINSNSNNIEKSLFYNFLKNFANDNNYNKIGELFYIFFQKKFWCNNKIINISYEYNFVLELNVFDIFTKLDGQGRLHINQNHVPQLNLKECILETLNQRLTNNYIECKYIYSTSPYLIFILNRRKSEILYYFGHFIYSDEIDLSSIIIEKDNSNRYVLSSIIKEKRDLDKNNNFIYITINRDKNGQFYYYENNKKILGKFENNGYFDHILIFKQKK